MQYQSRCTVSQLNFINQINNPFGYLKIVKWRQEKLFIFLSSKFWWCINSLLLWCDFMFDFIIWHQSTSFLFACVIFIADSYVLLLAKVHVEFFIFIEFLSTILNIWRLRSKFRFCFYPFMRLEFNGFFHSFKNSLFFPIVWQLNQVRRQCPNIEMNHFHIFNEITMDIFYVAIKEISPTFALYNASKVDMGSIIFLTSYHIW